MTLAQWADVSTIVASVAAVGALIYIAKQASQIRRQTELSLAQIQEFSRRSRIDLAYDLISKYGDPHYLGHFRSALKVLDDKGTLPSKKAEMMADLTNPFSFDFQVLVTFMENLANLYSSNHVDRDIIKKSLFTPVWQYYKRAERSEIIEELRKKYSVTVGTLWQNLAEKWEKEARPKA